MATRVKSCCGASRRAAPQDFCANLRITTGVTLAERGGTWTLRVMADGFDKDLMTAVANCPPTAAGARLALATDAALRKVVTASNSVAVAEMRRISGRQMPLVLMKDALFKLAGKCSSCNGRGCGACGGRGV